MNRIRKNIFKALLIVSFLALPGADIECEDDEIEIDWPDWGGDDYYYDYGPPPCCWYWW